MTELNPMPLGALVRRALRELAERQSIYDLPRRKFFAGLDDLDLSVQLHGQRAGTALGPAAGPHSQLAQNIALSWLGGGRIVELKTVQIMDELTLPRPCIDMATVGYNVEWSQELKLEQSLDEYVKAAMLIRVLQAAQVTGGPADAEPVLFDMSVGYDLKGIQQPRVRAFIQGMQDASAVIERLRPELPAEFRDLDFQPKLSNTLTLSTFHGCPPDEIERIIEHLFEAHGLDCIVKLNPTLLGPRALRGLLNEQLGYADVQVPDAAFEKDTRWQQAVDFTGRLGDRAQALGLGFGVKFTNTLIVKNHRDFFPATEREMYLSGPPLHVLAMHLVQRFRGTFGDRFPISFSAGIDKQNFADAVAIGLVPVTVCSDLLKAGGYGRAPAYLKNLASRMRTVGAPDIDQYIVRAYDLGLSALDRLDLGIAERAACETALLTGSDLRDAAGEHFDAWVSAARLLNTDHYVPTTATEPRYAQAKNAKPPRKVGSHLELFDCLTCDKCIPVCPNAANFSLGGVTALPRLVLERTADGWQVAEAGELPLKKKHQIANYADFCNECGNCDVFCPEDGGPYLIKPRYFSRMQDYAERAPENGFHLAADGVFHGRISGVEYRLAGDDPTRFWGPDAEVQFDPADPAGTLTGRAPGRLDLTPYAILRWYREGVTAPAALNFVADRRASQPG